MVVAGIDIGYSNLKVVTGDLSTGPRVLVRPGGACPLENVAQAVQQGRNPPYLGVTMRDKPWAAAMDPEHCQHWERELTPNFPFSDPYLALYHAALLQTRGSWVQCGCRKPKSGRNKKGSALKFR